MLGVGAALAWVLLATSPAPERRPEPPRKVEVEVTAVTSTLHQVVLESQGTVRARMAGPVATQVAGQVLEVAEGFTDGALVEAGALLVRLDPGDYALAVEELEQQLAVADGELAEVAVQAANLDGRQRLAAERTTLREAQLERVLGQRDQGVATEDDLLAAQVAELAAREAKLDLEDQRRALLARQATLRGAREVTARRLARARLDLTRTEVRAPYRARVVRRAVAVGEFVARGATVGELYAVGALEVRLPLTAQQLRYLELPSAGAGGSKVRFSAQVGETRHTWTGVVIGAEGRVDVSSRQLAVIARVEEDPSGDAPPLRPGSFVSAELEGRVLRGVYVIPRSAALGGAEVLIADAQEGVVRRRPVNVVRKAVEALVVDAGLEDGELLCVTPLVFAGDSLPVSIHPAQTPTDEAQR
ncbi:MAG: HlyD family efflux transporter periplasmic adaptor subunit [Planctomycetes bacterium]|nr:HlyD family efflux transporter periplasmic adaptor subunit [Planctomycetota bacterium]